MGWPVYFIEFGYHPIFDKAPYSLLCTCGRAKIPGTLITLYIRSAEAPNNWQETTEWPGHKKPGPPDDDPGKSVFPFKGEEPELI
jgi:hypothetical protein